MQRTSISWTQFSSNPIRARNLESGKIGWLCSKVSEGCTHCYAETVNLRYGNQLEYNLASLPKAEWILKEGEFHAWQALKAPSKIFVCDMTDLFHESIPDAFRERIFFEMDWAPWHTYQILTKRPEKMMDFLMMYYTGYKKYSKHLWLGTSVESKKVLDRIDTLREIPAQVRFLSVEPLLESVMPLNLKGIHWVIVGAESGAGRRPYDEEWAREIRAECAKQGSAFFYKQGSHLYSGRNRELDGRLWEAFP